MTISRIQYLRKELKAERISYSELHEIDCAADKFKVKIEDGMMPDDILDELEAYLSAQSVASYQS